MVVFLTLPDQVGDYLLEIIVRTYFVLLLSLAFVCMAAGAAKAQMQQSGDLPSAVDQYQYDPDDVAVNQGVVAYWYAHGYANAYCCWPQKWSDIVAKGLLLRSFYSPHTGEEISFDDGSLDFDGDMTFEFTGSDVEIAVQTTKGVVTVPGVLEGQSKCGVYNGGCSAPPTCNYKHCDVTICGFDCWKEVCGNGATCEVAQWMLYRSFELYECRYGQRPCNEQVWMASGLAPVDANWKERAPYMTIDYIYGKCVLKKAKVHCCETCAPCKPACSKCQPNNPCESCKQRAPEPYSDGSKCRTGKCGR